MSYALDYRLTGVNNAPFPAGVGQRAGTGAISRWRHYATIDWNRGPWGATLANNFQLGYSEPCILDGDGNSLDASGCLTRRVGSYSVWDAQVRYNVRYYVFGLLFVIFDVEAVFLYPWAVAYRQLGLYAFIEALIFIGILLIGYAYAWRKGAMEWI